MVADGVHILLGLSLVLVLFRSRRPEPYLVAVLAAAFPDIDLIVFHALLELGYVEGGIWTHRGVTHSLAAGIVLVAVLSYFGPWRAAAVGFASHVCLDVLTGGVQLLAPFDSSVYGLTFSWLLVNVLTTIVSVTVLLFGLYALRAESEHATKSIRAPGTVLDRFR